MATSLDSTQPEDLAADLVKGLTNFFAASTQVKNPAAVYGRAQMIAAELRDYPDREVFERTKSEVKTLKEDDPNWTYANMLDLALALATALNLSHDRPERVEAFLTLPMPSLPTSAMPVSPNRGPTSWGGCYICAYRDPELPAWPRTLPAGSPALSTSALGTCWRCNIFACSLHSSYPQKFECAKCRAGVAALNAAVQAGYGDDPESSTAVRVGSDATSSGTIEEQATSKMAAGLAEVYTAHRQAHENDLFALALEADTITDFGPNAYNDNLVVNLAGVIRNRANLPIPEWRDAERRARPIDLDAIGAVVRSTFALAEPPTLPSIEPSLRAVRMGLGALIEAYRVAGYEPDEPGARLPSPWETSFPVLLDPMVWLLGTAYGLVQ